MESRDLKLSEVPLEHLEKVFNNLLKFRGIEDGLKVLIEDIKLSEAFPWILTDEGHLFWMVVNGDISAEEAEAVERRHEVSAIHDSMKQVLSELGISLN